MSIELLKYDDRLGSVIESMISLPVCEFSTCHYETCSGSRQVFKLENTISDETRNALFLKLSQMGLLDGFEASKLFNDSVYFRYPGAKPFGKHQDLSFLGWSKYISTGTTFFIVPPSSDPVELLISPGSHTIAYDGLMKKSNCSKLSYDSFLIPGGSLLHMEANTAYSIPYSVNLSSKLIQLTYSKEATLESRQLYIHHMQLLRQTMVLKKILNSAS